MTYKIPQRSHESHVDEAPRLLNHGKTLDGVEDPAVDRHASEDEDLFGLFEDAAAGAVSFLEHARELKPAPSFDVKHLY